MDAWSWSVGLLVKCLENVCNALPEPIVLVIFYLKIPRWYVLSAGQSMRYSGLADWLSLGCFNKSVHFFIDYHSKLVL